MPAEETKPTLVFIRWVHPERARYIRLHLDQHVQCLSQFFNVRVVEGDCDYAHVCDTFEPDLVVFESGVYASELPRRVENVFSNARVPKLGFCNSDAMCASRSTFIADMATWGVETFFGISVSLAEYTPEIADRLFVWPNAIDPATYRDYGEHKNIPVLFTGSQAPHYPWRNRIAARITRHYPSMTCPHLGWGKETETSRMLWGERYAHLLNASEFVPACGTVARDIVRKHFEIPGCNACLIAERTRSLEAAGFVDGRNCIFADERDVLHKLDHYFRHPEELARIRAAGFALVHSRHTMAQRDQVLQWFRLHQRLRPSQRIIQPGPFEPLAIVAEDAPLTSTHLVSGGVDRALLAQGDRALEKRDYKAAQSLYQRALNYLPYLPEAKLRMAVCHLHLGDAQAAERWLEELLSGYQGSWSVEPDPVAWAWYALASLCKGDAAEACARARRYPHAHHPELARVRQLLGVSESVEAVPASQRASVHRLPQMSGAEFQSAVRSMLRACGRDGVFGESGGMLTRPAGGRRRISPGAKLARRVRPHIKRFLQRAEARFGYFLPYALSTRRKDEPYASIEALARDASLTSLFVHSAPESDDCVQACLLGLAENAGEPVVCSLTKDNTALPGWKHRFLAAESLERLRADNLHTFGMALLSTPLPVSPAVCDLLSRTDTVVLVGLAQPGMFDLYQQLAENCLYFLLAHEAERHGGYAIFRRQASAQTSEHAPAGAVLDPVVIA